jgi:hypothetical protein
MEGDGWKSSAYLKESFIADRRKALINMTIFILAGVSYGALATYYHTHHSTGEIPGSIWYATHIFFAGVIFLFDYFWLMGDIRALKAIRAGYSGKGKARLRFLMYSYIVAGGIFGIICLCYFLTLRVSYTPDEIRRALALRAGYVALAAVVSLFAYHIFSHMMVLKEVRQIRREYFDVSGYP